MTKNVLINFHTGEHSACTYQLNIRMDMTQDTFDGIDGFEVYFYYKKMVMGNQVYQIISILSQFRSCPAYVKSIKNMFSMIIFFYKT